MSDANQTLSICPAAGYFLIHRDNSPISIGPDWPDAALATRDRSKCALVVERADGKLEARVLHGVSDFEAMDAAERLAQQKDHAGVTVARLVGAIGVEAPANLWQRVKRFSRPGKKVSEPKTATQEMAKEIHFQIKTKKAAGDALKIAGWASTKNIDRDGDVVDPRSVADTLGESMGSLALHFNHNPDFVVGTVDSIELRDAGMWLNGTISAATNPPQVRTWIEEGAVKAMSIRFMVNEDKFVDDVRHITKAELLEVSVVTMPSNRQSTFSVAKGITDGTDLSCTRCHDAHCGGQDHVPFKRWPLTKSKAYPVLDADLRGETLRAGGWDLFRDANAVYRPEKEGDEDAYRKAGSYRLQHHAVIDGELKTVLDMVVENMVAVLKKSTELEDEDRAEAYDHLARHLQEFQIEPPPFEVNDQMAIKWRDDVLCYKQQTEPSQEKATAVQVAPVNEQATATTTTPAPAAAVSPPAAAVPPPVTQVPPPMTQAPVQAPQPVPEAPKPASYVIDSSLLARMEQFARAPDGPVDWNEYNQILDAVGASQAKRAHAEAISRMASR